MKDHPRPAADTRQSPGRGGLALMLAAFLVAACSDVRTMMPTPNLYAARLVEPFGKLAPELTSSKVELIYVTDRAPERDEAGNLSYGFVRSPSLAVGTTVVDLGEKLSWRQLVDASRTDVRVGTHALRLASIDEFARLPPTPMPFTLVDGKPVDDPDAVAARDAGIAVLRAEMLRRLDLTARKDVFVFVHGYHNSFEDAAFALAELWHFLGREGLPVMYTWPAGFPGIFGYTYDRESSEFTILHFKRMLAWFAEQPEVENVHIIAHSRGTDVATTALRELVIGARGAGISFKRKFKIANLVLAAPDLDGSVVSQRLVAERIGLEIGQTTLYSSPEDKAISLAEQLFASPRGRLGTLDISELNEQERAVMRANAEQITVVNFRGEKSGHGHSYFRTHPEVSSDLMLLLRYGFEAGSAGRPLEKIGLSFWRIPPGYPAGAKLPE